MRREIVVSTLFVVLVASVAWGASLKSAVHKYIMRGQILDVTDDTAYLCIGSRDGAKVGQELTVYKFVRAPHPSPKAIQPYFKREETGKIKITEVVDEHYATAKILRGEVKTNYVAELER